ncbi:VOC family protein [Paenibacillus silvae]|uniref:VOC family protein n=1 Tax=Paenibacillus silvae TaxID=1325358 RepID=UPI003CF27EC8
MNKFAIGHILLKAKQLKHTVKDYERWGFTVTYRTDPAAAHNAFIYFRDGSFLELFNPKPIKAPDKLILAVLQLMRPLHPSMISRYIHYIRSTDGITDYALDFVPPEGAETTLTEMKQAGAAISKKINMSKTLQDGRKQTWWIAAPADFRLPFLMSAYSPAVPCSEQELTHPNGALGIDKLVIDVPALEQWVSKYKPIFGDAVWSDDGQQCEYVLEKGHTIVLRQAKQYRISEIHLLTSKPIATKLSLQPECAHGTAIYMKQA